MGPVRTAAAALPGGRGLDARPRASPRRGRGALGRRRAAARHGLRALPGPARPAIRGWRSRSSRAAAIDPVIVRAIASHADFMGVSRDSDMEKTLFAVDELSGFVLACAYVRPAGHPRADAQVGQEEAQAAELRRRREPRRGPRGRRALGLDFDEHIAFVIAALEERAAELGHRAAKRARSSGRERLSRVTGRERYARGAPRAARRAPLLGRRSCARAESGINGLAIVLVVRDAADSYAAAGAVAAAYAAGIAAVRADRRTARSTARRAQDPAAAWPARTRRR